MRLPGEITREDYDAHPGVRWSMLRHMRKSPLHYKHAAEHQSGQTKATRTGSAVHTLTFEPHTFGERFEVYAESKTKGEGARKKWEAFRADAAARGIAIMDLDEYQRAQACSAAVRGRALTGPFLAPSKGRAEVPLTWTDKRTGLVCKARLDWLTVDWLVADLKTTRSADLRNFGRQAWHLGYFHQAHFYAMAVAAVRGCSPEEVPFTFLVVENEPPFDVARFEPCEETRHAAGEEVAGLMDRLAECRLANKWPGRYEDTQLLRAPAYVLMSEDEEWQTTITTEREDA